MQSMTGFGRAGGRILSWGEFGVELRSVNHKALEIVLHLPEGLLSLEDKFKREIAGRVKRGRVCCVVNIAGNCPQQLRLNKGLLKEYLSALKEIKKEFSLPGEIGFSALMNLPGVFSLGEKRPCGQEIWPHLKRLLCRALEKLVAMRLKEGKALKRYLKKITENLQDCLEKMQRRFKKASQVKLAGFKTEEEASSFLKNTDISEEIERLSFHLRNFQDKLSGSGPIGKELDFIAQEMQREINTVGAKNFDVLISSWVVQIKSQIERLREQVQNIE